MAGFLLEQESAGALGGLEMPGPAIETLRAESFDQGFDAGKASAAAQLAASFDAEREDMSAALEAERRQWLDGEKDAMLMRMDHLLDEVRATIEKSLVSLLQPFLEGRIRDRAIADFRAILEEAIRERKPDMFELCAPPAFHDSLRSMLVEHGCSPEIKVSRTGDFQAVLPDGCFETCIEEWLLRLKNLAHG